MAFPSLAKTWQLVANSTIAAQASATAQAQTLMLAIKNALIGFGSNPWTVRYSSDGTVAGSAGDLVDRWSSSAKLVWVNSAANHSWIVLRQDGVASHTEICIDCQGSTLGANIHLVMSFSQGFTGGSLTARPTATDENDTGAFTWYSGVATQHQLNVWLSSDGQCTRVMANRGGTNLCTYWQIDRIQNPSSGWTMPMFFLAAGNSAGTCIPATSVFLTLGTILGMIGSSGGTKFTGGFTYETYANSATGLMGLTGVGTAANSFDGQWPVLPIGVAANSAAGAGRLGQVYDMWWCPSGVSAADTFPNNASTRQFAAFPGVILPWTGDSTTPLLA